MSTVVDDTTSSNTWVEYDMSLDTGHMTQLTSGQTCDLSESLVKGQTLDPAALKAILELATSQTRSSTVTSAPRSVVTLTQSDQWPQVSGDIDTK